MSFQTKRSVRSTCCACLLSIALLSGMNAPVAQAANDTAAVASEDPNNDPFEPVNRAIFSFNDVLDQVIFLPVAKTWRFLMPEVVRDRVGQIFVNMQEPVVFGNKLLQGEFRDAGSVLGRFAINSTLGMGGMFEVAAPKFDLPQQSTGFGETLHRWGAGSGPYLVLPVFGPSNVRDAVGFGVDAATWPWFYVANAGTTGQRDTFNIVQNAVAGVDTRERNIEALEALRTGSVDYYAQMRSIWQQNRNATLGIKPDSAAIPMFDEEDTTDMPTAATSQAKQP